MELNIPIVPIILDGLISFNVTSLEHIDSILNFTFWEQLMTQNNISYLPEIFYILSQINITSFNDLATFTNYTMLLEKISKLDQSKISYLT